MCVRVCALPSSPHTITLVRPRAPPATCHHHSGKLHSVLFVFLPSGLRAPGEHIQTHLHSPYPSRCTSRWSASLGCLIKGFRFQPSSSSPRISPLAVEYQFHPGHPTKWWPDTGAEITSSPHMENVRTLKNRTRNQNLPNLRGRCWPSHHCAVLQSAIVNEKMVSWKLPRRLRELSWPILTWHHLHSYWKSDAPTFFFDKQFEKVLFTKCSNGCSIKDPKGSHKLKSSLAEFM